MCMYEFTDFMYRVFKKLRDKYYIRHCLTQPLSNHWLFEYKDHEDKTKYITLKNLQKLSSQFIKPTILAHNKAGKGEYRQRTNSSFECPLCHEKDYYPMLCSCCEVSYIRYLGTEDEKLFDEHYNYIQDIHDRAENYWGIIQYRLFMGEYIIHYD